MWGLTCLDGAVTEGEDTTRARYDHVNSSPSHNLSIVMETVLWARGLCQVSLQVRNLCMIQAMEFA